MSALGLMAAALFLNSAAAVWHFTRYVMAGEPWYSPYAFIVHLVCAALMFGGLTRELHKFEPVAAMHQSCGECKNQYVPYSVRNNFCPLCGAVPK